MAAQLKRVTRSTIQRTRLTSAEKKIISILKANNSRADTGTLLDNGLNKHCDRFTLQKQLTRLCHRELIIRSGITVFLL